jgi:Tfp pilus assembly protein PilF
LKSIEEDGSIQVINMTVSKTGDNITKEYLSLIQKETQEISVAIVFGRLMCELGEYDKSLQYFEELLQDPNGEDIAWIEFNVGRTLHYQGKWAEARQY